MKARVQTFSGEEKVIEVELIWFVDGEPVRVWGEGHKFDMREEPFTLEGSEMFSVSPT